MPFFTPAVPGAGGREGERRRHFARVSASACGRREVPPLTKQHPNNPRHAQSLLVKISPLALFPGHVTLFSSFFFSLPDDDGSSYAFPPPIPMIKIAFLTSSNRVKIGPCSSFFSRVFSTAFPLSKASKQRPVFQLYGLFRALKRPIQQQPRSSCHSF